LGFILYWPEDGVSILLIFIVETLLNKPVDIETGFSFFGVGDKCFLMTSSRGF